MSTDTAVDHGILFYPRGGSSLVVKNLAEQTLASGLPARIFAGSLGQPGAYSHAPTFYGGLRLTVSDYTPATAAHAQGEDALAQAVPLHPSYEDRVDVPDRVFAAVAPHTANAIEDYWRRHLTAHQAGVARVLHLHHLTPLHGIARSGHIPVVTTLHGTELKFLANAQRRLRLADALGLSVAELGRQYRATPSCTLRRISQTANAPGPEEAEALLADRWHMWTHARHWVDRLRGYARASTRIVVISEQDHALAQSLAGVPDSRIDIVSNGVDTDRFTSAGPLGDSDRHKILTRWLVDDPQGWADGKEPGSIRYTAADVRRILHDDQGRRRPLLLWIGRFLAFKHLNLLLQAMAALRDRAQVRPALLILGGHPGEWEGVHPYTLALDLGITDDVFFAGWRPYSDLVDGLRCSDLLTAPSVDEPFGLIYLEAMASGTPVIASASGGPLGYVTTSGPRATGWLPAPGDLADLVAAIEQALGNPAELARRGEAARRTTHERYSWRSITPRYFEIYDRALADRAESTTHPTLPLVR
ncbi:glycosyltransferase family 4 protein [Streptomyces cinereoruber]|uniref:glycosyltransferase family 4 protein n=1 Tax=Streptomyces cinereoruber TaxID=67260 RepID=UPI00363A2842